MRRLFVGLSTAFAAAAVVALAGCGAQSGEQAAGGGSPSTSPSGLPSATLPTSGLPTSGLPPSSTPSEPVGTPSGPTLVLDGVAAPGVEPGCVVFATGGRRYLLVGATGKVPTDVPIRVRGVVLTGVLSYCQQGTPLKVVEISRR
jgi:hypothetical protein